MTHLVCCVLFLAAVFGTAPTSALGQGATDPQQRPAYRLPRYEEDWSYLRDANKRDDYLDFIKFIPFSEDGKVYLSLGGEARETYERFGHPNFGLQPADANGYLLQRYLLHADFHAGSRFRFFGELSSSIVNWRTGGPRPIIDEDRLDVHQGFFDVVLSESTKSNVTFRVGRQEIALGSGRLVALREGPNVPASFDGFRLLVHQGAWHFDGFATKPVANNPGVFDDGTQHTFSFWGVYSTRPLSSIAKKANIDLYYLGLDRKKVQFNQGVARETRHTLGARVWGQNEGWSYDAEGMYQFGDFGSGNIRAWRLADDTYYTFRSVRWRPTLGFAADIASGDKDPSNPNLQTFNALFQSGTYSGRAQILGPSNTIRLEPSLALAFSKSVAISAGWGFYWRESVGDGLYGIPGNLFVPSNGAKARYEGSRPIAELDWQINRQLSLHVNYIYVFNGPFEHESLHVASSLSYIAPWVTYRF